MKSETKPEVKKWTIIGMLCLYLALGLIAILVFYFNGSVITKKSDVEYSFFDNGSLSNDVDVKSVNVLGESGAMIEQAEEVDTEEEPVATIEEEPALPEKKFYKFKVTTQVNRLRVRKEPSDQAKILNYLDKGSEGYVFEVGDEWSLVSNGKVEGYSYNEYLDMTEVSLDELPDYFPKQYK